MPNKRKSFFERTSHPYYIYAPPYTQTSCGIRLLHSLCHILNELGQEAYIYTNAGGVVLHLRTPILTDEIVKQHQSVGLLPIGVYPEIVSGNPINTPVVARWILNKPGHLGGDREYDASELVFNWDHWLIDAGTDSEFLLLPFVDRNIFHNNQSTAQVRRNGFCYYAHKYLIKHSRNISPMLTASGISLCHDIPRTQEEIANILRRSEVLYIYEPSGMVYEALLCGCQVAVVDTPYLEEFADDISNFSGLQGFKIKEEDIGKVSVPSIDMEAVLRKEREFEEQSWIQLDRFIELTQAAADNYSKHHKDDIKINIGSGAKSDNSHKYMEWFDCQRWNQHTTKKLIDLRSEWQINPTINILIVVTDTQTNHLLSNTINSLLQQTIDTWRLTIVAPVGFDHSTMPDSGAITWLETDLSADVSRLLAISSIDGANDWFLLCEPGIQLEPIFCNVLGEMINRHPEWRFIYTDEDRIDQAGKLSTPYLKPDINLDLLRSRAYMGQACLIHGSLWEQIPADERIGLSNILAYAAALRCYEIFGAKALGHVDEILFHYPLERDEEIAIFEELGKALLQQHLHRQGIPAEVSGGLIAGSFFVDYALHRTPLVSIIIPTKNTLDMLKPCVESIIEKTGYKEYEIIIVDNGSDCPETLKYLAHLRQTDERIRVIPYPREYNYSAINNLAAKHANGEYLLLLNNDTVVLQDNWLERLVALGLREDIGAVGCRLVLPDQRVQHAGIIIGLGGAAEHIGFPLPIHDTGYMGRGQLTQNFLAVTGACLLVRKSIFNAVHGLDERDFAVLYNDVDFCLKLVEHGYRNVWTPFVTLVHHQAVSLNKMRDAGREKRNAKSQQKFVQKWIPTIGKDPSYNRHLSLRNREWVIDGEFSVPWNPDIDLLPRIVAQPPDLMGVGYYRMLGPVRALTDSGLISSFILPEFASEARFLPSVSELVRTKPTTLFLQNAFTNWHIEQVEWYTDNVPDVFRIFGQDDIVFAVPQKSIASKYFGRDTKARLRKAVGLCHRVIATSEPIAEAMRGMADDIRVMPNYLERARWGNLQAPRKERRKPRVGWAGAQQHQGDLEFIIPVVEATADEVEWVFMGMCLAKLRYHISELHNPASFDKYPAALAALDLDLAIAPLEINRFNAAKSNLRILEYGAVGFPTICTDIEPYRNAPVTLVPNNPQAWIDAIRTHVHEMDATRAAGQTLRKWVLDNWMLDQHLDEWLRMLLPD